MHGNLLCLLCDLNNWTFAPWSRDSGGNLADENEEGLQCPAVGMNAAGRLRDFGTSRWRLAITLHQVTVVRKGAAVCN
jgi:hypothetical protein